MTSSSWPHSHSQPGPTLFLGDTDHPKGFIYHVLLRSSLEPQGKYVQDRPRPRWSTQIGTATPMCRSSGAGEFASPGKHWSFYEVSASRCSVCFSYPRAIYLTLCESETQKPGCGSLSQGLSSVTHGDRVNRSAGDALEGPKGAGVSGKAVVKPA